jgi:hypothetical protein
MFRFAIVFSFFLFPMVSMFAQSTKKITIHYTPIFGTSPFKLIDTAYTLNNGDSIRFTTLKFYISSLELINNNTTVFKERNSFHLIDKSEKNSSSYSLFVPKALTFTSIRFNIGIDSAINIAGALGGDLDPLKGMYWTWQNGYINWKIEGTSPRVPIKNHSFQFHLGGYQFPFNSIQKVQLPINNQKSIDIVFDIKMLMDTLPLATQFRIMSPTAEAVLLSKYLSKICSVL